MRDAREQELALECLNLADGNIERAEALLRFVLGTDREWADTKIRVAYQSLKDVFEATPPQAAAD